MDEFARRLRSVIERSGMQQKELASSIKLSPARLSNYVNGHSEPSYDILVLLCRKLKVSADYLLGLSDSTIAKASQNQESTRANFASLIKQDYSRDPLAGLDEDLRSKGKGYIDALFETQNERNHSKTQEA